MSISIKNINISIGGTNSDKFKIKLDGALYHLDNFQLEQKLMQPVKLTFTLFKDPVEDINEPQFTICGYLIGKEVRLTLQTEPIEKEIDNANTEGKTADIEFEGFISKANSARTESKQSIQVEALSKDAVLIDHPRCQVFNEETLGNIIKEIYGEANIEDKEVDPENQNTIFYTVQYNETHYDFLRRMARRHCEWFFSTGKALHFGRLKESEVVQLAYPSQDITHYGVHLQTFHPTFCNVGMGYNRFGIQVHIYDEDYIEDANNPLSDATFKASKDNYAHKTSQLTPASLESDDEASNESLDAPIFCEDHRAEMLRQRSNMLIFEGETYCSRLHIGTKLNIKDNYISSQESNSKSEVQQDEILVTEVTHTFQANEQYKNTFKGITAAYPYPPYEDGDIYPHCDHPVVATVVDTEDPKHWGRVRLRFPWQINKYKDKHKNGMTPWVHVIQPYTGGNDFGTHLIPEKFAEVLVQFDNGNFERPYVSGAYVTSNYPIDSGWYPGDNNIKAFRTSSGHTIEIKDASGEEGGSIKIYDSRTNNYVLTFDTDQKLIRLQSAGNIELEAGSDIKIKAGNNITVKAGNNIKTNAGNDITTKADNDISSSSTNDTSITAGNDLTEVAENDMRITVANDRNTKVDRNDTLKVSENQQVEVGSNQNVKITQKQQTQAMDIREEAKNSIEMQSMSHTQKASTTMSINANASIDIKAAIVKVN